MAASLLENQLESLHRCLKSTSSLSKEQIVSIIEDIRQLCIHEVTEKDIDLCCSVLFDKDKGLVCFLSRTAANEEFQVSKQRTLELLSEFIQKTGKKIIPYALDIKDVCVSLFSRERLAKVKNAAMPVLVKVIELSAGTSIGKDMGLDKLVNKFFMELTKSASKLTATVKENIYILLGIICEVYPEYMTDYAPRLIGVYITALKAEMTSKTKKPELSIIAGCLEGLTSCLVNFTQSAEEGSKNSYEIFKYARMAIDPDINYTRYDVPRAGLRLFSRHAPQFDIYLVDDYQGMYEKLRYWSKHQNREILHLGTSAIEAFLMQVSETLVERAKEGKKEGAIFKFFIQKFRELMNEKSSSSKELSLAIRGYGLLAAPCRTFLQLTDVQFMFSEMMNKSEQQYLSFDTDMEDKLYNLPSYLEALANIVKELDQVSETYCTSLERLMIVLVDNLPNLHPTMHFVAVRSLIWVMLSVMPKGSTFQQLVNGFVFQSLIRTCSHPPVVETEQIEEESEVDPGARKITYKDYIQMWTTLLNSPAIKEFARHEISIEIRQKLTEALYDELMKSVLRILHKLDLTSQATTELSEETEQTSSGTIGTSPNDGKTTDPIHGLQPSKPKDFQIFINLVDFCRDLLPNQHAELFERWIFTISHAVIVQSTQKPLVSGFYKMLAISMKIANKLDYFQDLGTLSPVKRDIKMEVDGDKVASNQQRITCFTLMKKFAREVLVRMKQFRDDLLASCLTFILSLPKEIVVEQIEDVVPAIQVTLEIGMSYLPLAMVALDALEYWSQTFPHHVLQKYYCKILPSLDSYLRTADQGSDEVTMDNTLNLSKSKSGRGRKKVPVRLVRGKKEKTDQGFESKLSQVKQRIVRFLGGLGGSINHNLLANTDQDLSKQAIAWDTHQHLRFDMPFIDMKPTIYFDSFLPYVVDLATKSTDRQTKVASCELLHSLVLFCIGRNATLPGPERYSMRPIYSKLFPSMLKLACDVDLVTKQLFEPLLMQLIHWFTNNKKAESEETMSLLDSIYDGIIQPTDTALRDFSAVCLREFLQWSIKQTKNVEKSPINAKSLLKRLYSYALHPGAFKRLGAALAFNNIYTVFREDNALVNLYTFQILVHFVESLAIAHRDEVSLGTLDQCRKSLEHVERIIKVKKDLLKVESKARTEPRAWSGVKLDIAVRWLLRQCGRPQTECRHICMKLVHEFAPLIQGVKSTQNYFQIFYKKSGGEYYISRFEGGGQTSQTKPGIINCPTLTDMVQPFSLQSCQEWFDMLLAPLDCYTWVFGESLLNPQDVFSDDAVDKAQIFKSIQYFIENIALSKPSAVAELCGLTSDAEFYTPKEIEEFNKGKCTVIVRLLYFIAVMLGKSKGNGFKIMPSELWSKPLWRLVCLCVVEPAAVGFNIGDIEVMNNLPKEMEQLLRVFTSGLLPQKALKEMKREFSDCLTGDRDLAGQLNIPLCDKSIDSVRLQQLIAGYDLLNKVGILGDVVSGMVKIKDTVIDHVVKGMTVSEEGRLKVTTISPTAQTTAKALLGLAFHLGYPETKLVKTILDQTKVEGLSKDCSQTLGELFFTSFKSTVAAHLATTAKESMSLLAEHAVKMSHRVSSVMVAVVDTVSRDKDLRKNLGNDVVSAVLGQWKHLSSWWESKSTLDLQSMALLLLTKLVLLDSKFVSNPSHPHFNAVFDMYQKMLVENKTNLAFKTRVLDLLPFFSTLSDPHSKKLKSSLDRLVADNFPLKSTEFTVGSPQYKDYTAALDRILNGLELSGSLMLLELLISIFCREQSHLYEPQMLESLNRFTRRLPADKQKSAIDVAYDIYTQDGAFPSEVRMATVDKVALPMLRLVHKTALIQFYTSHIGELRTVIDNKLVKGAGLENQLVAKICVYKFLEVMYCRLNKDEVFSKSSVINEKFCQAKGVKVDTGKEMTQVIMKNAHEAKGEDVRGETTLLEPRRQFHCAAYNLLIAVLSCTQTDAKFYAVFLFQENEAKGSFVLDNLVDKDKTYEFPSELKAPLARKKQYVSIRNEVKEDRQTGDEDSPTGYSASVHLASEYLADSSLSEDFNQYDFSATSQLSGGSAREKSKLQVVRKSSYTDIDDDSDTKVTVEGDYVELEMDDLNQHECMADLIAVLKHMQRAKIIPVVESGIVPEMPVWMKHLHDKMKSARTHKNIKFFIAKLIVNTSEVFRPYSKYWLLPLCQLILDSSFTSINYFVIDVVVAMLSWHKVAIPQDTVEERAMVKRLAEFLTAFVYSDTRPVYRNNLELLKTLMQVWKDRAEVPYDIIYKQLKQPEAPKKEGSVGIQVLGVVLSCKLPPYGPVAPVDQDKYFSAVVQYCTHDYKTVYAAAAEVVGLIFRYMADKDKVTEGSFHSYVVNLLGTIQQAKPDNFIVSVHRMQRHYPPIADRFMNKLFFLLPNLHGEFRNLCLEMVLSRIDTIENVFMELKGKGLVSFLTHRDEDTQLTSLNIVKAIGAKLKPAELLSLMPEIAAFSSNPSVPCRNVMYEVLMWIYDNYREEDNDDGHQIMQQTKESLLKGLGDDDLQCRLLVQNFWSSETRLPTNTADRLASMLEAMYSPVTEQQFLSYTTNLILEMTSKSPDYQREMFEHPLEECKFQDYKVKSSWRQRHAVMTPLFASTMSSQTMDMDTTQPEDSVDGQLRATQDVQFSATQDASRAPYNWLTGNSLDTFTDYSTVGSEAPSSLLFTIGTADMAARVNLKPRLKPRQGFGQPRPGTSKNTAPQTSAKKDDDVETSEMSRLKRRFLKDQEQTRIYFAKRYSRLEKMRKEAREEQKARRENQVTMYRRYRKGDLPDIQIKYSYIIAPLQAVAHRDSTIAKLLFGAIFKAIFAKLDEVKTEREVLQTIEEIRNSLNNILSVSTQYFPPFISCMLDILYELRTKIEADIANVGMSAVVSNLQPLGICVLEEQLILREPEERPSKRGRTDGMNISKDTASWIELARLYKSVNEYDVLQGIFSSKIGTKEITKEAVQLESRGDYYRARKLYEEALSTRDWPDGNPSDIEVDMWDDCRMECLDKLTQWQTLEDVAVKGVDNGNIAKVWEDTFYQEHYLPYIIRSKVKLMLQGDESQQTLLKFIDDSMKLPEAKALLESRYCEELAMMYIWQSDYDRARHYVNMAIEKFQQDWSSTDPLMVSSRTSKLQQVQPLVEMQEFLTLISNENNFSSTAQANKLIKKWESRSLHSLLDPVNVWDDLVTNRNVFMDHISSRLNSVKSEDSMDVDKDDDDMQMYVQYLESKVRLKLQMVESCCHSNNHKLALNLLISTKDQCKETGSELVNLEWSHLYTKTHQTKARSADTVWNDELINSIITTVERLGKSDSSDVLKSEVGLGRQHYTLRGESLHLLAVGIHSMDNPADLSTKNKDKLMELTGAKKFDKDELIGKLVQHGYDMIKSSLSYEGKSTAACRYGMEEAYLAVATYCNRFLRMQEDEEIKMSQTTLKQFPETTIVCLLNAVKLDSMEARQRIPRLLQLVELYPDTTATFVNKAAEVPSWMFIMWISQMMALLDKPHAAAVHNIVSNLAREYPQAVVYPYQLSSEGYRFGNTAQDKKNIGFVEKLAGLLDEDHLPLVSKFIFALDNLSQPDQIFKDWADDIKIKLAKRKADKKELLTDFYDMYKKLVDVTTDSSRSGRVTVSQTDSLSDSPSLVDKGKYSKKFAERFKKDIESGFGKDGKKLVDMTYSTFAKLASKIQEEMGNEVRGYGAGKRGDGPLLPPKTLKDYCQWLSDFNPNTQGRNLEIPGQYDGLSKPMPEYHIKIAGFDQRVLVMTSIRKPKRITIRGNDEREYNYLVKGGEDLRQDQRIEQLFFMMNQVLDKDPACRQRKLKLKTYQVVPLTPRVGLIEWMNNTMPLKDFLYSNFTEDESKVFKGKQGPTGLHVNWTSKFHKNQALAYHAMYQKCTRTEVTREFQLKESKVPWDLTRRAFHQMSTSPEAFHVLRCKFAVTHASICICQYILGIGDRHLSNFMINLNTGEMVGIDFGHAFGSATQFLPIPELMPIRLTRQIRNIMMPLQVKGLMGSTMIHTLRALRNNPDLLLNTMDIFIKEPSVDWMVNANRQLIEMGETESADDEDFTWYPMEKVSYVKRKLRGENPCYITRDELRLGHSKKACIKSMESVLMGEKRVDTRADLPRYNLSVEQQVAALIDQATDTNILGRVYVGWEPWM